MSCSSRALVCAALLALALPAAVRPSAAEAAYGCSASAVRVSVLGGPAIQPAVADSSLAACRTATAGLSAPLPAPLSVGAVTARTVFEDPAGRPDQQRALAAGGIADVGIGAVPISLPTPQIGEALASVTVPLTGLLATLGLPGLSLDLRPALQALVPDGRLPVADLVRVRSVMAYAGASCRDGRVELTGDANVAGLSVLGVELGADAALEQALPLLDTASIDPSGIDLAKIALPAGISLDAPVVGPLLQTAIRTVLDALPPVAIPATLAQVKVTPGAQARTADGLLQQALRVQVSAAGISLADVTIGEAAVSARDVDCSPPAPAPDARVAATDLVLGCTKRRLVLTDVQQRDGRVRLLGVADRALAGRTVSIRFRHTGRTVARTTVRADGSFRATAALPSRRIRATNRARYEARIGRERSLSLKLTRRMVLSGTRARDGKITLSGRVVSPLARPARTIALTQQVSCKTRRVIRRIKPSRSGRFRVTIDAPAGELAAVYRLSTRVRKTARNAKTYPTFTLPRAIALR